MSSQKHSEQFVARIRQTHGDEIADIAQGIIINQPDDLSPIEILALAERKLFEKSVGTRDQLAQQRTNSWSTDMIA